MNKISKKNINQYKKYYSLTVNTQEQLLSSWLIVVASLTTTAIAFFHLSLQPSLLMSKSIAALFTILLIACALFYNLFSLYNFYQRTTAINIALTKYDKYTNNKIKQSQFIYSSITIIITLVQLGLMIIIIQTLLPKLLNRFF